MAIDKKKLNIQNHWKAYDKKVRNLLVKLSLYIIIFVILIIFLIGINIYRATLMDFDNKNIAELRNYISIISSQSSKINSNLALAKKYNERWQNASEEKKSTRGVEPNLINTQIFELAKKYNISKYDFTMSVPQVADIKIDSERKILELFYSNCKISFNTSDDVRAISFFEDLKNNITGYVVIENYSIRKNNEYSFEDLVRISKGQGEGAIGVSIDFKWYVAKKI